MIVLKRDGVVDSVGDPDPIMREFVSHVVRWLNAQSGVDADGRVWSVKELPDRPEFEDSRNLTYLDRHLP